MTIRNDPGKGRAPATGAPRREFLGWDAPCLPAAADWLLARHGADLERVIVALPGARAGRRLEELLVARAGPLFHPPQIVTAGRLTDRLLQRERPAANRLTRTLQWVQALRAAAANLAPLVSAPPESADLRSWIALAETLRELHGELAAEELSFEAVAQRVAEHPGGSEAARWNTLAGLQRDYLARLARLGLADPHEARRQALHADRLEPGWDDLHVVLVGVVEMTGLTRRLIDRLGARASALIFAPAARAGDFDARGCVLAEPWRSADVPLALARWTVVDKPADQAARVADVLGEWSGRFAMDEIVVGVPAPEVVPHVERRLADLGVPSRAAEGRPLMAAAPCRLLHAAGEFLGVGSFAAFAALLRHPDVHALVQPEASPSDALALLDDYHAEHLPDRVTAQWLGGEAGRPMRRLHAALLAALGALSEGGTRPLRAWAEPIRAFLLAVHGGRPLDRDDAAHHDLLAAFEALGALLDEIEGLPDDPSTEVSAATALAVLLHAGASLRLPPSDGPGGVELLGWLELPLDDAPALVVTGFNDGHVPQALRHREFLPPSLRHRLGMGDDELRVARDAYALTLLLHSRPEVHLVTARRNGRNDPLLPSRLAFHVPDAEIVERAGHWLPGETGTAIAGEGPPPAPRRVLPGGSAAAPTSLRVTSFRRYLQSPYLFYLQDVRRLRSVDDEARELDPLGFGTLAHEVLEAFGRDEVAEAVDADAIAIFLDRRLDDAVRRRFGPQPLPAVVLQAEQLRLRLRHFARWQAGRRANGWRIARVEWAPDAPVAFDVDGETCLLRGTIDRIDVHEASGAWAVLDYKTSEAAEERDRTPRGTHGPARSGAWHDLQLPLYALLAQPLAAALGARGEPQLGYIALPHDAAASGLREADWTPEERGAALETARQVVRAIRAGRFFALGDFPDREPIFAAIAGLGLPSADDGPGAEAGPPGGRGELS